MRDGPSPACVQLSSRSRASLKEGRTEEAIREGPEELTLRAEEVDSQQACFNVGHIAEDRWRPPLVDADWHAFCQAIYEGIEGSNWEELYEHYEEVSGEAGVRKPNETQNAGAFWKMKAAKDSGEDFHVPDDILGRNRTRRELWEEHLKDPIVALDKALKCAENPCQS